MRVVYLKAVASSVTVVTERPFFFTMGGKDLLKAGGVEEKDSAPAKANQALALKLPERPGDDLSRCSDVIGELIVTEPCIEEDTLVRGRPASPRKVQQDPDQASLHLPRRNGFQQGSHGSFSVAEASNDPGSQFGSVPEYGSALRPPQCQNPDIGQALGGAGIAGLVKRGGQAETIASAQDPERLLLAFIREAVDLHASLCDDKNFIAHGTFTEENIPPAMVTHLSLLLHPSEDHGIQRAKARDPAKGGALPQTAFHLVRCLFPDHRNPPFALRPRLR